MMAQQSATNEMKRYSNTHEFLGIIKLSHSFSVDGESSTNRLTAMAGVVPSYSLMRRLCFRSVSDVTDNNHEKLFDRHRLSRPTTVSTIDVHLRA